jgi:acetyl-CoA C-acetyltransferase
MDDRVAVVGVHQTTYKENFSEVSLDELIYQTTSNVLSQAGITIDEVDNIAIASSDQTDGRAISSMVTAAPVGSYLKDLINLSSSSEHAFMLASMQIMSGVHDLSLVVAWSKCSESPMEEVERLQCEPYFTRRVGMNNSLSYSLQASSYREKYNPDPDVISRIAIKNRENALANPLAHRQSKISLQTLKETPVVAWPLKADEIPPYSDGVCAMLLASEKKVSELKTPRAWVKGLGWASDSFWMGERDLTRNKSLENAAKTAYKMAGIDEPFNEVDVAELDEMSPYDEAIQYESLGFCERGGSEKLIQIGATERGGKLPVNLSGGVLSSNPEFCSGLVRIAESSLQVMGLGGEHQANDARLALATSCSGFASQNSGVVILSAK